MINDGSIGALRLIHEGSKLAEDGFGLYPELRSLVE